MDGAAPAGSGKNFSGGIDLGMPGPITNSYLFFLILYFI